MHTIKFIASLLTICLTLSFSALQDTCRGQDPKFGESIAEWEVSIDDGQTWQSISVPSTIEDKIDVRFDGISKYRTNIRTNVDSRKRAVLRFEGVATEATVFLDGKKLGTHLGGWTPFEFDITEQMRSADRDGKSNLLLELICDEKVGHNTQGFLPIIAPHFSGIWKPVRLQLRDEIYFLADKAHIRPDHESARIFLELPISKAEREAQRNEQQQNNLADDAKANQSFSFAVRVRERGKTWSAWRSHKVDASLDSKDQLVARFPVGLEKRSRQSWSPDNPILYDVDVKLLKPDQPLDGAAWDRIQLTSGFRDIRIVDERLLLNGNPLVVRGVLNWGYAPPSVAPTLDEAEMRKEIDFARARGFNLMKFCLWIPPKRYLELCDEYGMLAWVEYPAWHPDFSASQLASLEKEYVEFFQYDRNHPSVVLRSLTCETGPSASLQVIQRLYDLCKEYVPGAIVEDDSSWIQWNRVHDFYDDHPYGNNHTWPSTLARLKKFIQDNGEKPLILGEAIAADTWVDPMSFAGVHIYGTAGKLTLDGKPLGDISIQFSDATGNNYEAKSDPTGQFKFEPPFHYPIFLASNRRWLNEMAKLGADLEDFDERTREYAMAMRKYQIEKYRELVPTGGYVVSVIRDFRKAGMGLIDFQGQPKSTKADWQFQSEHSISIATEQPRLAFRCGTNAIPVRQSRAAGRTAITTLLRGSVVLPGGEEINCGEVGSIAVPNHGVSEVAELQFEFPIVSSPTKATLKISATAEDSNQLLAQSKWSIWIIPAAELDDDVRVDFDSHLLERVGDPSFASKPAGTGSVIRVVSHLDEDVIRELDAGGKFILVPPIEASPRGKFTLATSEHWFLRGGPVVFPKKGWQLPSEMLMSLQHFDLAGPVIQNIHTEFDFVEPLIGLWDNHDISQTKTHGLVVSMPVGKGQLLLSSLNHWGADNIAGQWVLAELANGLAKQPSISTGTSRANYARLMSEVNQNVTELHERQWRFHPDNEFRGIRKGWHLPNFDDVQWGTITCRGHWEGQGYADLDGWAWYRIEIKDQEWQQRAAGQKVFLNFQGVDDHYRVWVNGNFVGQDGVIETKETAFENRKSYEITPFVKTGEPIQIAIAVYDWYGSGGIFRPVSLSRSPLSTRKSWLKK